MQKYTKILSVISMLLFLVSSLSLPADASLILLDKDEFSVSENIIIGLNFSDFAGSSLEISSPSKRFEYPAVGSRIRFTPTEPGSYMISLIYANATRETASFSVKDPGLANPMPMQTTLTIEKEEYAVGEMVQISIGNPASASTYDLEIAANSRTYKFFATSEDTLRFFPQEPGNYVVTLSLGSVRLSSAGFIVREDKDNIDAPRNSSQDESGQPASDLPPVFITGSVAQDAETEIQDSHITVVKRDNRDMDYRVFRVRKDAREHILLRLNDRKIKEIRLENASLDSVSNIRIDSVEKRFLVNSLNSVSTYAIDPSGAQFDNATVTATAVGDTLWKCKDWDFAGQNCLGTWVKLKEITPGENYTFLLSTADPGFAETGVASVNTKKPIYHPNETVELIMVVLDKFGYAVSGAEVMATVTDPNNATFNLTGIVETRSGVYEANFSGAGYEGSYTLFVKASGADMESSMVSSFEVASYYDFDIIRNTPVVIDPWKGSFLSEISIYSYSHSGLFNFTEALPGTFILEEALGAEVKEEDGFIYLTWKDLSNGTKVSYKAKAPQISPNLFLIGPSLISYDSQLFYEARPWYLAVDPPVNSPVTSLSFYMNDYATGSNTAGRGVIDNNEFDEVPIEINR
ncbi:MAG: hypothetical protein HGA85_04855, partial [Nanoarchaeota archaeon]|nr:hypothetical protein [Nanoarchaeota archaeon]